jgi:hypothetical protein
VAPLPVEEDKFCALAWPAFVTSQTSGHHRNRVERLRNRIIARAKKGSRSKVRLIGD